MSKIKIPLENIRQYVRDLFHEYMDEQYEMRRTKPRRGHAYDCMDDDEVVALMQLGFVFPEDDDFDYYNYDEDYDDEDYNQVWPPKKEKTAYDVFWENEERKAKSKHKRGKGKKSKARLIDITQPYSGEEEDPTEYASYEEIGSDGILEGKEIWFYPNYRDKYDKLEFNTLKAFDDFCAENGYVVPPYIAENIAYRRISHTCLRPDAREDGIFEIMAEESYADMMYEACDVKELSQ